jgi:hypothetical protein
MDLDVRQTETPRTEPSGRVPDAAALRGAVDVTNAPGYREIPK